MVDDIDSLVNISREIFIEDCWAKMFAMHIMCPCPDPQVKRLFINFVIGRCNYTNVDKITEQFVFDCFPMFINNKCLGNKMLDTEVDSC